VSPWSGIAGDYSTLSLRLSAAVATAEASATVGAAGPGTLVQSGAERRHLTVMFCDLVGSTALSARLDPEDIREVIGAYHRCCARVIGRGSGFVAKYRATGCLPISANPSCRRARCRARGGTALKPVEKVAGLHVKHGSEPGCYP
jgi:class 3 adenylate cyclase